MKKKLSFIGMIFILLAFLASSLYAQTNSDYDRALYFYKKGNFEEAVIHLQDYVERRPEPSAYYLMGYALYKLGNYDQATRCFEEAYLIDPDFRPKKIDFRRARP